MAVQLTEVELRNEELAKLRTVAPDRGTEKPIKAKRIGDLTVDELQGLAARRVILGLAVMVAAYLFLSLVNPG